MSTEHLKLLGNMTHLVSAAMEGIREAGIPEDEADAVFATIAGGKDKRVVKSAFFLEALKVAKERGWILDYFDLGNGDVFLVDEYIINLDVDDSIPVEEIEKRMNFGQQDWEYLGTTPQGGTRKVRMAIGRLNHGWIEESVSDILARPNCPLKGTGAWVREGYLKVSSNYDGKGALFFPDKASSRWQSVNDGLVCFPSVWGGVAVRWSRGLNHVRYEFSASYRLCLLLCE